MIECTARPDCPGCALFEKTFDDWRNILSARLGELTSGYEETFDVARWHAAPKREQYRVRSRMVVTKEGLGFYQPKSRDVVVVPTCVVHHPQLEASLDRARRFLEAHYDPTIRFIDARFSGARTTTTFCLTRENPTLRDAIAQFDWADDHVHLNISDRKGAVMQGPQSVVVGDLNINWSVGDREFEAHPQAFFQVNTEMLRAIHDHVRPHLTQTKRLLDLYCGIGVHGLSLAGPETHITGFDQSEHAIYSAQANSQKLGRHDTWIAARDTSYEWTAADAAVINPGRSGIDRALTQKIVDDRIDTIIYVACEPVTFFRDVARFATVYDIVSIDAFEMMPRTEHVELVAILKRTDRLVTKTDTTGSARWVARVVGTAPNGKPPGGRSITVKKLRRFDDSTVVSIDTEGISDADLRSALRAWGHPVIGDTQFGDGQVNRRFSRNEHLDRPLLHCVEGGAKSHPVPGFLLPFFSLPRHLLQSAKKPT